MFRPYNPKVLVGNWFEDRALEDDVIKDYLEKRSRGELYSQQIHEEPDYPISLTTIADSRVHIGDRVQLKCDGNLNQPINLITKAKRADCYLGNSSGRVYGTSSPEVNENTVLVIKSIDNTPAGVPIKYGQRFTITTADGKSFLHSDLISVDKAAKKSRLQVVDFVDVYNHECDWLVTHVNPRFRLEAEGSPIPANEKIVLIHAKTNKALAVVADYNHSSSFEIVAHTFLDSHRAEEDVNRWKFVSNVPVVASPEPRLQ